MLLLCVLEISVVQMAGDVMYYGLRMRYTSST